MLSPVARAMRASASGIAREAAIGGIHAASGRPRAEEQGLVAGHLLVEEPEVVEVGAEVLPHPAEVGETHRLTGERPLCARSRAP